MPVLIALAVVAAIVVLFLAFVSLKASDFQVTRRVTVAADPSKPFEQVNDLHLMNKWNPWVKLDPQIQLTYEGPDTGVGSSCAWDGNRNVGAGRQTIVESRLDELVRMKLEFFRPFPGTNEVIFTTVPDGNQTVVTWTMNGKLNFMMKVMGCFMSMDKMCGKAFDQGLRDMKAIAESGQRTPVATPA